MATGIEMMKLSHVGVVPRWTFDWSVSGEKTTKRPITTSSAWVARSASARKMLRPAASFTPTMLSPARSTTTRAPPMMSTGCVRSVSPPAKIAR